MAQYKLMNLSMLKPKLGNNATSWRPIKKFDQRTRCFATETAPSVRTDYNLSFTRAKRILGIDLGTTNSAVAMIRDKQPEIIPNQEGERTTPSVVSFSNTGDVYVGSVAKRQQQANPENTFFAFKRLIGCKSNAPQVKRFAATVPFRIVDAPNTGDAWVQDTKGRKYSPEQLSALVLNKLKTAAEEFSGYVCDEAVITVPAHFNEAQRQATKNAATIAGLKTSRIINEPTAAALAFGYGHKDRNKRIAVYDLGGGTFDVAWLDIKTNGVFQVVNTDGDTFLGGEDFDNLLLLKLVKQFQDTHKVSLAGNRVALLRVKEAAENAKKELSSHKIVEVNLPYLTTDEQGNPLHMQEKITREQFEDLARPLINRTIAIMEKRAEVFDEILLVGGMTRMPMIERELHKKFRVPINKSINPDEAVALGAALQASILVHEVTDVRLVDIASLDLGVELEDGTMFVMVPGNTPIPFKNSAQFTNARDHQTSVDIKVFQGNEKMTRDNHHLGTFTLLVGTPVRAHTMEIEITFDMDAEGLCKVDAFEKKYKVSGRLVVNPSGLSKQQLAGFIGDHQRILGIAGAVGESPQNDLKAEGKLLIEEFKRMDEQLQDILEPEEYADIHEAVEDLKVEVVSGNEETLKPLVEQVKAMLEGKKEAQSAGASS